MNAFIKRTLLFLGCIILLLSTLPMSVSATITSNDISGWPTGPSVAAESAIVMDLDSGTVLYSKNIDQKQYPASITKIMTALVALENSNLTDQVGFSHDAINGIESDSNNIGLYEGEILSMEACLYALMLESANEVCLGVAEHISGTVDDFVALMNKKAAQLGCTNTNFVNPNGLHDDNHYMSAFDIALIAQAAYQNPTFREICLAQTYTIEPTNMYSESRTLSNHHKMLPESHTNYSYEACTGGKTGFTSTALNTLLTYAEGNGKRLVCVLLNTNGAAQNYSDTKLLLDYGLNYFHTVSVFERASSPDSTFLYPDLFYGQPTTLGVCRSDYFVTLPSTASFTELQPNTTITNTAIIKTYQYNGYTVGKQEVPTKGICTILTSSPSIKITVGPYVSTTPTPTIIDSDTQNNTQNNNGSDSQQITISPKTLLIVICVIIGILLVTFIVLQIIVARKREIQRQKQLRKKRLMKKRLQEQERQRQEELEKCERLTESQRRRRYGYREPDDSYSNRASSYQESSSSRRHNSYYTESQETSYRRRNTYYEEPQDTSYRRRNTYYEEPQDTSYRRRNTYYEEPQDTSYRRRNTSYEEPQDTSYRRRSYDNQNNHSRRR